MERYLAFISYRHREQDQRISVMLRRKLENWRLPKASPLPKKRKVFRDTDELPTSSDLGADLEQAIADSGWLIALCSEEYCKSLWCMREVEEFIVSGRKDRILPVLIDGTSETAVPESIKDIPPIADLRGLSGLKLRRKADECAALLLGRMAGEDAARYASSERRSRSLIRGGIFAAVMIAVTGFALYAQDTAARIAGNNEEIYAATLRAEEARAEAIEERNNAITENGRFLAQRAWDAINSGDDRLAVELALSALPEDLHGDEPVSEEALSALRAALSMPGKPKDEFRFSYSVDTDFRITAYLSGYDYGGSKGMVLFGEEDVATYGISFTDRAILPLRRTYERKDRVFYDGDRYRFIAWEADPAEEGRVRVTYGYTDDEEPRSVLDLDAVPVSASFSQNRWRVAVIDESGALSIFDVDSGKKRAAVPGSWKSVYYPCTNEYICAVSAEGTASLIDVVSMETVCSYDAPGPVKELQYCSDKDELLVFFEGGVRIFDLMSGKLITEIVPREAPERVLWGGYDEDLWQHEGNAVVMLYEKRIDVYEIVTETDQSETDYIPLYDVTVNDRPARAFYSHDSRYVYQQQYGGQLSKWDAETGRLIWKNDERWTIQGNVHDDSILSADGSALWRVNSNMTGIQRIDAGTGEKIWEQVWIEGISGSILNPEETTGACRDIAFCRHQYDAGITVFDTASGDLLWEKKDAGIAFWSEKGDEIIAVNVLMDKEKDLNRAVYSRLDPRTGRILFEKDLIDLPYAEGRRTASVSVEQGLIGLTSDHKVDDDRSGTRVELFYLEGGEPAGTWTFTSKCSLIFSCAGVPAVRWQDVDEGIDMLRVLEKGGGTGPVIRGDSREGRELMTVKGFGHDPHDRLTESGGAKYVVFGGDAASLNHPDIALSSLTITRISDGLKLLALDYGGIAIGCDVAPNGSSICIFGYYTTPRIMKVSDPDTLAAKARRKLAREEGK